MVDIRKYPVWVNYKGVRTSFFDMYDNATSPKVCLALTHPEELKFKVEMVQTDSIVETDIEPFTCEEDPSKTCDFYMSNELKDCGHKNQYACSMCKLRSYTIELIENWESGKFDCRKEEFESDLRFILTSTFNFDTEEMKNLLDRMNKVKERLFG